MKVALVIKEKISKRPPIQALLSDLKKIENIKITLISADNEVFDEDVNHWMFPGDEIKSKLVYYYKFRKFVIQKINENGGYDLIWFGSFDTLIPLLYSKILENTTYNVQMQELYDNFPIRRFLAKKACQNARNIIVPEYNRAHIIKCYFSLINLPKVLPNKPSLRLDDDIIKKSLDIEKNIINNGKVKLIYQGHIGKDRNLDIIAKYCHKHKNKVDLYLMGTDHGYVSELKTINPGLIYLGYVKPPHHLRLTSLMDIGVMHYSHTDLNNIFCAPNKIWEYSFFNLPSIANDLPGITHYITRFKCGEIYSDERELEVMLDKLIDRLDDYKLGSASFYSSIDRYEIVRNIVEDVR